MRTFIFHFNCGLLSSRLLLILILQNESFAGCRGRLRRSPIDSKKVESKNTKFPSKLSQRLAMPWRLLINSLVKLRTQLRAYYNKLERTNWIDDIVVVVVVVLATTPSLLLLQILKFLTRFSNKEREREKLFPAN